VDPINCITLCENCKYLVVGMSASISEQTAAFCIYDAGSLVLLSSLRIPSAKIFHTIKISPCSGYLVLIYTPFDNDHFYIKIYDLQSPNFLVPVAQTALNTEIIPQIEFLGSSFNPEVSSPPFIEFALLSKDKIYFFRYSSVSQTLKFHSLDVVSHNAKVPHIFTALGRVKSQKSNNYILIGCKYGGLVIVDERSGAVLGWIEKLIDEEIS
jgi:hypothetical protein